MYAKKSIDIAAKYNDIDAIETVTQELVYRLTELQKWEEALQYVRRMDSALKKPFSTIDSMFVAFCYGSCYLAGKQYVRAGVYTNILTSLIERFPEVGQSLFITYRYLFSYFMAVHQYPEAKKYASMYLSVSSKNRKSCFAIGYLIKSRADSAMGNFQAALSGYQSYKKLTDSMLNETTSFQFAQQQVEYETEKKDNDIKLLKQQEIIQQSHLKQSRLINNIVIGSVVFLAVLLALLYSRYRTKQRLNKQLQIKQQEINEKNTELENLVSDKDELIVEKDELLEQKEWLVKEIHHRVKNNLQMIISLLNA